MWNIIHIYSIVLMGLIELLFLIGLFKKEVEDKAQYVTGMVIYAPILIYLIYLFQ